MLNIFHMILLFCKSISLFIFLFPSWPESQSASLPKYGVRLPGCRNLSPLMSQAELRGLKVLPKQLKAVTAHARACAIYV